jgi:hypothetical protein
MFAAFQDFEDLAETGHYLSLKFEARPGWVCTADGISRGPAAQRFTAILSTISLLNRHAVQGWCEKA